MENTERRQRNATANAEEYRERRIVLDSNPTMLYVELTQNCNLNCRMCRSGMTYRPERDMSLGLYELVAAELMPDCTVVDLRGWGESTMLRDFVKCLRIAASTGARLRLVTNGLSMTDEMWSIFWHTDGVVAVSIDAASQELATKLGRGNLAKVTRNVREGVRLLKMAGRGTVYFNTVVSRDNLGEISRIVDLAASLDVPKVVLNPVQTKPDDPMSLRDVEHHVQRMLEAVVTAGSRCGVTIELGAALTRTGVIQQSLPDRCSNPWSHAVIAFNGDVIFCDHLIAQHEYSVGNLGRQSFRSIWNGPQFAALRLAHINAERTRDVRCAAKCSWCYSYRYGESEAAPFAPRRTVFADVQGMWRSAADGHRVSTDQCR